MGCTPRSLSRSAIWGASVRGAGIPGVYDGAVCANIRLPDSSRRRCGDCGVGGVDGYFPESSLAPRPRTSEPTGSGSDAALLSHANHTVSYATFYPGTLSLGSMEDAIYEMK